MRLPPGRLDVLRADVMTSRLPSYLAFRSLTIVLSFSLLLTPWVGSAFAVETDSEAAEDTKFTKARPWDSQTDLPRPIADDKTITFDYPIVYVRVPRPY